MPAPDDAGLDEPLIPGPTVEDSSLLRRFAAEYRGPHPADDALWWLAHPAEPAPRGVASPLAVLQPLRAALYRPGAGAAELDAYQRAETAIRTDRRVAWLALQGVLRADANPGPAPADPPAPVSGLPVDRPPAVARSGRRPLIVVAAAFGLALVTGGGFAMLQAGSPSSPAATSHPTPTGAPVVTVDAHAAAPEALSVQREADLLAAGFRSKSSPAADNARNDLLATPDESLEVPQGADVLVDANDSEDGAVTSSDDAYVRAHPAQFGGGGTLQLHVVTKRAAAWTWRVSVLNRSTRAVRVAFLVVGAKDHGQVQSASLALGQGEVPVGMRLALSPTAPYFWAASYLY